MESKTVPSNHSQDMMQRLNNDRKTSAKYCDITLIVNENKYPAHKCIFGLLSPFFDKMFSIEMKERYDNKAVIKGISKEVFEAILDLIYTGSIKLNMKNVFGIIEAAHYMDLPYVKECCTAYLEKNITPQNWPVIIAYGKRYGYEGLLEKVDTTLLKKFHTILFSKDFFDFEVEEVKHLLGLVKKNVGFSETLFYSIINWIKHDAISREQYAEELFMFVKFSEMSLEFLHQVVAKEKMFEKSQKILRTVFDALGTCKPTDAVVTNSHFSRPQSALFLTKFKHLFFENKLIAVDSKNIWKLCGQNLSLKKRSLKYDHSGGSVAKWKDFICIIGGFENLNSETFSVHNLSYSDQISNSTECWYGSAAIATCVGYILVTGGVACESSAATAYFMQPRNPFKKLDSLNLNRHGHALVSIAGSIFAVGGCINDSRQSLVSFNPRTNSKKTLPPMEKVRHGLAAVVLLEEIFAIGGSPVGCMTPSCKVEKFHILAEVWSNVASLNVPRYRPGAGVIDSRIVVVGGGSSAVEVYDEKNNEWNIIGECDELKNVFAVFSG